MKGLLNLKNRLDSSGNLIVQQERGYIGNMHFSFNSPYIGNEESFFNKLPIEFIDFLKLNNGATLFKDIEYSQWGCKLFSNNEIFNKTQYYSSLYGTEPNIIFFADFLGDCDLLGFDMNKYNKGEKDYLIYFEEGQKIGIYLKGDFSEWLDRFIVCQGTKYWNWI